jgi:DNA-binding transcriptional ArsR family regulator
MLIVRFSRPDLANIRFAISPLVELHQSVRVLDDPSTRALHLHWVVEAQSVLDPAQVELLRALQPRNAYTPDFVHPPPRTPLARFEDEVAEMLETPADQVREEVLFAYQRTPPPPILRRLIDEPDAGLAQLAGVLRSYWSAVLEGHWPRIRAVLEGDVLYRARQLADGGANKLLADLHPEAWFEGGALKVEKPWEDDVVLDGRGLLFVPSVFVWPRLAAITEGPWQPTLIYPARGVGMLWEPGVPGSPDALVALIGRRRADVLSALDVPRSTSDVASRLGLAPASVSQHLSVLRDAGLVHANRVKRVVLYARTARGDGLLQPG